MPATKRRNRSAAIDHESIELAARILERVLGHGYQLVHSSSGTWRLRHWDSWLSPLGEPRMAWYDVDDAPEGQLGQLLMRHQERRA